MGSPASSAASSWRALGAEVAWAGDRASSTSPTARRSSPSSRACGRTSSSTPPPTTASTRPRRSPLAAFAVNAAAPHFLARAARDAGALLVHVSTDYVFDGRRRGPIARTTCRARSASTAPRSSRASTSWPRRAASTSWCARAASSAAAAAPRRAAPSSSGSSRRRGRASRCASSPTRSSRRPTRPTWPRRSIALVRAGARGLVPRHERRLLHLARARVAALARGRARGPVERDRARRPRAARAGGPPSPCSTRPRLALGLPPLAPLERRAPRLLGLSAGRLTRPLRFASLCLSAWAVSSAVEHWSYTPGVTGSNPVPPTRIPGGPAPPERGGSSVG